MATLEELENGLRKAHAVAQSGDDEKARKAAEHASAFASEIRRMRNEPEQEEGFFPDRPSLEEYVANQYKPSSEEVANELKGLGRDIISGGTALARGGMGIAAGAVGDIGHFTGSDTLRDLGYGAKQRLQEDEQYRRDNTTSMPLRIASEVATGGAALKGINYGKTLAQNLKAGAGSGFTYGALTPATSDAEQAGQIALGTTLGVAIPSAVGGARAAWNKAKPVLNSLTKKGQERIVSQTMNEAAGPDRAAIIRELEENIQLPGGSAGAGEVTAPVGRAEFSALQRVGEKTDPTGYVRSLSADNAARDAALKTVSGSADDRAMALALRSKHAGENYPAAYADDALGRARADDELMAIVENPFYKDQVGHAVKLMKAEGLKVKDNLTQFLQYIKIGLDKSLSKRGDDALSSAEHKSTLALKNRLTSWLDIKNPQYGKARTTFAEDSVVPNQQTIGKVLRDKLVKPGEDVGEDIAEGIGETGGLMVTKQNRGAYEAALRNEAQTIKKGSGESVYKTLDDALTPEQMAATKAVSDNLKRRADYETISTAGGPKAMGIIEGQSTTLPQVGMFNPKYSVLRSLSARLSGRVQGKSIKLLAEVIANPARAAEIMKLIPQQDLPLITATIREVGRAGTLAAPQITKAGDF